MNSTIRFFEDTSFTPVGNNGHHTYINGREAVRNSVPVLPSSYRICDSHPLSKSFYLFHGDRVGSLGPRTSLVQYESPLQLPTDRSSYDVATSDDPESIPHYMWLRRGFSLVSERLDGAIALPSFGSTLLDHSMMYCECSLIILAFVLFILGLPFSLVFCLRVVPQYERAVIFRLGRLTSKTSAGPGLLFIIPCLDTVRRVDLRTFTFDVPTQEVLTRDSVTVAVNAVVYYRIFDPVMSVVNVYNVNRSTRLLAQTTLRNVLGTMDLLALLTDRERITTLMQEILDTATGAWGMKVERVEIKDVRLPVHLQRTLAAEAEATREANARVIAANAERAASHSLREAAVEMSKCPIALQLRYLQTLSNISAEHNSTIIFPIPLNLLTHFCTSSGKRGRSGQSNDICTLSNDSSDMMLRNIFPAYSTTAVNAHESALARNIFTV